MANSLIDSICAEEPSVREVASGRFPEAEVARLLDHAERCPSCSRWMLRSGAASDDDTATGVVAPPAPLSPPPPEEVLPQGALVGRYMVLEKLGSGGMGVVYAAYDPELNRRLALKLLHAGLAHVERSGGQTRLLREAQALARLSHPHVTSIYDVGTWKERVFIAMELVEGPSLRDWLKLGPQPWHRVVETFIAAGRGLAAAHAAGLVHRDFKPDNVLLGKDGRVRVLDFGLARQATALQAQAPTSPSEPVSEPVSEPEPMSGPASAPAEVPWSEHSHSPLATPLTRVGLVIGTPAYMAPESYGGVFDARADQFSYCVALYELLYGERPYGRHSGPPRDWKTPEPPREARVPASVRRILLRGLELEPQRRWPSMEALLEALGDTLPRRSRHWLVAAGLVALTLGLALPLARGLVETPCHGGGRRLVGLWDGSRREALGQAFHATGSPTADEAWTRTARVLDTYAHDWETMHAEACEATRVRGEQSDAVLSLRMACLERRLQSLRALTGVYEHPDAALMDQAARAAHSLPPIQECANVEALQAPVPLPEDPPTQHKVEGLRARLAEARALFDSGRFKSALEYTRSLAQDTLTVHYRPLQAEVLELRGALEEKAGDLAGSEASLKQAVWSAEAGRHDEVLASASARLVRSAMLQAHYAQGREWAEHARAVLERMGGNERIEAFITNALGAIFMREDQTAGALEAFRRVLTLRQRVYPADHPEVAAALNNLGAALTKAGRSAEARETLDRAQSIYAQSLGAHHPETANALHNLAILSQEASEDAAAVDYFQRALAARASDQELETADVAATLDGMGTSYCALHQYTECLASYERGLAIRRKVFGPTHTDVASSLSNVGHALRALGRKDESLARYQESLRLAEAAPEHAPSLVINPLGAIADVLRSQGKRAESLALYQRALALAEKDPGEELGPLSGVLQGLADWYREGAQPRQALVYYQRALVLEDKRADRPDPFEPLVGAGECQLALEAPAQALALLERALALPSAARAPADRLAHARFLEARALWSGGNEARRPQARELARLAQKALLESRQDVAASQVTAWLETHPPP